MDIGLGNSNICHISNHSAIEFGKENALILPSSLHRPVEEEEANGFLKHKCQGIE